MRKLVKQKWRAAASELVERWQTNTPKIAGILSGSNPDNCSHDWSGWYLFHNVCQRKCKKCHTIVKDVLRLPTVTKDALR